ncbi:transmembrane protein 225B isoform X2 [Macaca mulatta]
MAELGFEFRSLPLSIPPPPPTRERGRYCGQTPGPDFPTLWPDFRTLHSPDVRRRGRQFQEPLSSCLFFISESPPLAYTGNRETWACAFLALVLHALEIQALRMKLSPLQFSVLWPYYVLGFGIFLFIVAGTICLTQEMACPCWHLLSTSQRMKEDHGSLYLDNLESLGGELSSVQKETQVTGETVI